MLDITHLQTEPPDRPEHFYVENGHVRRRDIRTIRRIVVHQTACDFGVGASLLKAAGGDAKKAELLRAKNVAAHVTAFMQGEFVYAIPVDWVVKHGNGFNIDSVGLEVEGLYPGLTNVPSTIPGKHSAVTPLTDSTIHAAREAVKFLVEKVAQLGGRITHINAHRQASTTRRADPGEGVWKAVVVDYARPVLGLKTDVDLVVPPTSARQKKLGYPIPREWDPSATARY